MADLLNNMPSRLLFPYSNLDSTSPCLDESFDFFIKQMLHSLRIRLDMEVAFISQFTHGRRVFKYIDNAKDIDIIQVGASDPLDESYCQRVVDGRLPELIHNAQLLDAANELAATKLVPVGGHLSVPIYLTDGKLFGTYCTFCRHARMDLNDRDHALIRVFADITASLIENSKKEFKELKSRRNQIEKAIQDRDYYAVFQPIFHIKNNKLWGYEALTRFNQLKGTPDKIFEQADELGLGTQLGIEVIACALADSASFPQTVFINLNATPELILSGKLAEFFASYTSLNRYVLEITEHVIIQDYQEILLAIAPLRKKGMRLAIDDTGAGYASFRHILLLKPEIIKLDISLIRDIDQNEGKQALASALVAFSRRGKHLLIAEGVETKEELAALRALGVDLVQGYLFSKAMPVKHFEDFYKLHR
jgi:EAL domain-containing protein (putative c-di-GMP-specific phosphodiesterase class I)